MGSAGSALMRPKSAAPATPEPKSARGKNGGWIAGHAPERENGNASNRWQQPLCLGDHSPLTEIRRGRTRTPSNRMVDRDFPLINGNCLMLKRRNSLERWRPENDGDGLIWRQAIAQAQLRALKAVVDIDVMGNLLKIAGREAEATANQLAPRELEALPTFAMAGQVLAVVEMEETHNDYRGAFPVPILDGANRHTTEFGAGLPRQGQLNAELLELRETGLSGFFPYVMFNFRNWRYGLHLVRRRNDLTRGRTALWCDGNGAHDSSPRRLRSSTSRRKCLLLESSKVSTGECGA